MRKATRPRRHKTVCAKDSNKSRVLRSVQQWHSSAAAKLYITLGWLVFPVHSVDAAGQCTCGTPNCSNAGKHPATPHGFKDATTDLAQVERWFRPRPVPFNIAVVTGKRSGLTAIDIDMGPGKVGAETWKELIKEHGEPKTLMARTGSGGTHLFFTYTPALKTGNNRLGQHVDVKNDGGCVIVAPSRHKSGGVYAWENWGTPLAPVPACLIPHKSDDAPTRGRPRKDDVRRRHYSLQEVADMLKVIPADDRDLWRSVGIILGREFDRSDEAKAVYEEWSEKWDGEKAANHDAVMHEAFYEISQQPAERELSLGTIVKEAVAQGWAPKSGDVPVEDFVFYGPEGSYLYLPTLDPWSSASVNVAVSSFNIGGQVMKATEWLKTNRCVTSLACDPIIEGKFAYGMNCVNGELVPGVGACVLNTYRPSTIELGDPAKAGPFLEHCSLIFNKPGDADQFLNYFAHLAQHPGVKPRFALLIGGEQGVGKDTAIDMCVPTFGVWNVANIAPSALSTQFNEFVTADLVRISETANQKEMSRFVFNELVKTLIAGSPDFCVVNPKYGHKFTTRLRCGVAITSNHLASGIYIPQDDRRYDVLECATKSEMGLEDDAKRRGYFEQLWSWFQQQDGARHVAAFLHARDLTGFSANNGQRKTAAHQMIIQNSMSGDEWFNDALEAMGNPDLFRGDVLMLQAVRNGENADDVRGKLPHASERAGFKRYLSPTRDGRWPIGDKRKCTLYLRQGAAVPTKSEREKLLKTKPDEVLPKY